MLLRLAQYSAIRVRCHVRYWSSLARIFENVSLAAVSLPQDVRLLILKYGIRRFAH